MTEYRSEPQGAYAAGYAQDGPQVSYTDARPDPGDTSLGRIVGEVVGDLSTLMRQELELAKAEVKQEATKSGKAVGMLAGAGVAGHFVLLFLSLALAWAIGNAIGYGWAFLVVAVLWAIVGAVLYGRGRKQLREVNPKPERTIETLKEDVQWAKNQTR
jgi:hypothetical protein